MAPPPPPRAPLPSLFTQTQHQSGWTAEAQPVAPLRWCRALSERDQAQPDGHTLKRRRERPVASGRSDSDHRSASGSDASEAKKPPSLLQREEREALVSEVRALEDEIERLRIRAGLPTRDDQTALREAKAKNEHIDETIHQTDLFLGRVHSLVSNQLLLPTVNPMSTFIHLPVDREERRAILCGMQDLKLRRGAELATQRLHDLDHLVPYKSEETFTSATGEYHYHRYLVIPLSNFRTARQLYETYLEFISNLDVSVTDKFGQLAVREDTEEAHDPTIWNQRIVTVADDVGVTEELNVVGFARFYPHSAYTNSPMGLVVLDTVNVDDLYPYVPEERTCKDVQAVHVACEVPKPGTNETVVVLKQCLFAVQLAPQCPIAPYALKKLQANTARWPNEVLKFLRGFNASGDERGANPG